MIKGFEMNFTKQNWKNILKLIRNKKLLDIGSAGQGNINDSSNWIFGMLEKSSRELRGIDIIPCSRENVIQASAEDFDLKEKFEVVTMFDVIEHLDNVGFALKRIKKHLDKKGILIITTPNLMSIGAILDVLSFRGICGNPTHTLGYNKKMLKLILNNNGFDVKHTGYFDYPLFGNHKGIKKVLSALRCIITYPVLLLWRDYSPTLFVIAKVKQNQIYLI